MVLMEVAGFCWILLSVFDPDLAPYLRPWIQEIGPLLPLLFFRHSKDDTWHSKLASVHAFVLFFPDWVQFGYLRFRSNTPAISFTPTLLNYSELPPAWHGSLQFPLSNVLVKLLF